MVNSSIDSSDLLNEISLSVPISAFRSFPLKKPSQSRSNHELFNPFRVSYENFTDVYNLVSRSDSIQSIKETLFTSRALPTSCFNNVGMLIRHILNLTITVLV